MKSDSKQRTKRNHESKKKKSGEVRRRTDFNFYQRYKLNYAQDGLWGWYGQTTRNWSSSQLLWQQAAVPWLLLQSTEILT